MKKRILSALTALCMVMTMLPTAAFATDGNDIADIAAIGTSSTCHTAHDASCGWAEAVEGGPCGHQNEDGSFSCAPEAGEDTATPGEAEAEYTCAHTDGCGYVAAAAAADCTHACEICKVTDSGALPKPICDCTRQCVAADTENGIEASIQADCPVCGVEKADLALCIAAPPPMLRNVVRPSGVELGTLTLTPNPANGQVYFGTTADGTTPALYRIVAKDSDTITLFYHESSVNGLMQYDGSRHNNWSGSALCNWLNGDFKTNAFTEAELAAMATQDQTIVLPSVAEVSNTWGMDKDARSGGALWWLRSPASNDFCAAFVDNNGTVIPNGGPVTSMFGVRPAFKLHRDSVLFASAAEGGKSGTAGANLSAATPPTGAVKLTILDDYDATANPNGQRVTIGEALQEDNTLTIPYSGATTGTNQYLSAVVRDGTSAVIYYGKLADTSAVASGTATVTIPPDLAEGWTLEVFSEQINADKATDYASAPLVIAGKDTIAPTITAVTAVRNSSSSATVKFTSNEPGSYLFYLLVDVEEAAYLGEGRCNTGEQTIELSKLDSPKSLVIHLDVTDRAGNTTRVFPINIPAYVAPPNPDGGNTGNVIETVPGWAIGSDVVAVKSGEPVVGFIPKKDISNGGTAIVGGGNMFPLSGEVIKWNGTWNAENMVAEKLVVSYDKEFSTVLGTSINGRWAPIGAVIIKSGSTIVELQESYLKTLPNGAYTLRTMWKDGDYADFKFTVEINPFTDISDKDWFYNDVMFVYGRGLLTGTTGTTFGPNQFTTRGMFVTTLGRLAGIDKTKYTNTKFTDVKADAYYAPYVAWAVEKQIATGTTATTFNPNDPITRQEMAVMLVNYSKAVGDKLGTVRAEAAFADSATIAEWAKDAVRQVQIAGIIMGRDGNLFAPTAYATRAEVSATLHRYIQRMSNPLSANGWEKNDSGKWLYYENGKAVTGKKTIGGKAYEFDGKGLLMKTEATVPDNKKRLPYIVKKDDTLWAISKKYDCTVAELVSLNNELIVDPNFILVGWAITVPQK